MRQLAPTSFVAVLPPGVGAQFLAMIARGKLFVGGSFSYAAPTVASLSMVPLNSTISSAEAAEVRFAVRLRARGGVVQSQSRTGSQATAGLFPTTGGLVAIAGANFGVWTSLVSVTVGTGAAACVLRSVMDTRILCVVPPGGAAAVSIALTVGGAHALGSASAAALMLHYAPPSVASVVPPTAPTGGGQSATIIGRNFMVPGGACASVSLVLPPPLSPAAATVLSCTPTELVVAVPPGSSGGTAATGVAIRVATSSAQSVTAAGVFAYDPPLITGAAPVDGAPVHGFVLWLRGANFGRPGLAVPTVAVGASTCHVITWDDTVSAARGGWVGESADGECRVLRVCWSARGCVSVSGKAGHHGMPSQEITCQMPAGSGAGFDVTVEVLGRAATLRGAASYYRPHVRALQPAQLDARWVAWARACAVDVSPFNVP